MSQETATSYRLGSRTARAVRGIRNMRLSWISLGLVSIALIAATMLIGGAWWVMDYANQMKEIATIQACSQPGSAAVSRMCLLRREAMRLGVSLDQVEAAIEREAQQRRAENAQWERIHGCDVAWSLKQPCVTADGRTGPRTATPPDAKRPKEADAYSNAEWQDFVRRFIGLAGAEKSRRDEQ